MKLEYDGGSSVHGNCKDNETGFSLEVCRITIMTVNEFAGILKNV